MPKQRREVSPETQTRVINTVGLLGSDLLVPSADMKVIDWSLGFPEDQEGLAVFKRKGAALIRSFYPGLTTRTSLSVVIMEMAERERPFIEATIKDHSRSTSRPALQLMLRACAFPMYSDDQPPITPLVSSSWTLNLLDTHERAVIERPEELVEMASDQSLFRSVEANSGLAQVDIVNHQNNVHSEPTITGLPPESALDYFIKTLIDSDEVDAGNFLI